MEQNGKPVPANELERLISLSEYDIDYLSQQDDFSDLTRLAAKVAGTSYSSINILDALTQWTIAAMGLPLDQISRDETVCQYTIAGNEELEITDLPHDPRFKDSGFMARNPDLRYYLGVPITTEDGHNIGALCVLDKVERHMDPEKVELLRMIAGQIVNRLRTLHEVERLKSELKNTQITTLKLAHDIRGPLSGIVSLTDLIQQQGDKNKLHDVLQLVGILHKGSNSLLELAEEILGEQKAMAPSSEGEFTLATFREKLLKLYQPQTLTKNLAFEVTVKPENGRTVLAKNKLMQIAGNLVSNAVKFTPEKGKVTVNLDITKDTKGNLLHIIVSDTGVGLSEQAINEIMTGSNNSQHGTGGEKGYGFGLSLVKHLVDNLQGVMEIRSKEGEGATFHVTIPQR